jgi:hypothetical protein
MQNGSGLEKKYISLIIEKISIELHLNDPENWQQRDFETLSLLIEEKTGVNLSVSTLKRIKKNQFSNIPQKHTLNALAQFLNYKDWYEFKLENPISDNIPEAKSVGVKTGKKFIALGKNFFYIPVFFVILVLILLIIFKSQPAQSYSEVKFSSRTNVSEGVPNTVIFDYDISMADFDSASIQQSWDNRRRAEIKKDEKYSTSVYYYPGYHRAKLIINDKQVKEIPVYITTDGWLCTIQNPKNELIPVYVRENCISGGRIYISPGKVKSHNIDMEANNYSTSFFYVNKNIFGDSDNFTFETRIKNSLDDGGLVCQSSEISIMCEFGRHFIEVCAPGCIGSLYQKFGSDYRSGKNNDFSAFGTDLNQWNDLKIGIKNKVATVSLNQKEIYRTSYSESNGAIKGIFFHFAGCGSVDYARLFDADDNLTFSEDFE